jgi:hypothetical protein
VRTKDRDPLALVPELRSAIARLNPSMRVTNARTQQALIDRHLLRERLLAFTSLFFAGARCCWLQWAFMEC